MIAFGCHAPGAPEATSKNGPGTHRAGAVCSWTTGLGELDGVSVLATALGICLSMSLRSATEHAEAARLHAGTCIDVCCGQSELEELSDRRRPRRHPMFEPEIVNSGQFFRREHDLEALGSMVVHVRPRKYNE